MDKKYQDISIRTNRDTLLPNIPFTVLREIEIMHMIFTDDNIIILYKQNDEVKIVSISKDDMLGKKLIID